jgi:hypothetical protein
MPCIIIRNEILYERFRTMNILYFVCNYHIKIPKHIQASQPWGLAGKIMSASIVLAVKQQKKSSY